MTCVVRSPPIGLGSPVFDKLEAELAKAAMSLPASKVPSNVAVVLIVCPLLSISAVFAHPSLSFLSMPIWPPTVECCHCSKQSNKRSGCRGLLSAVALTAPRCWEVNTTTPSTWRMAKSGPGPIGHPYFSPSFLLGFLPLRCTSNGCLPSTRMSGLIHGKPWVAMQRKPI